MADDILRSKHAFGSVGNIQAALDQGLIDQFDILFLTDENNDPQVGWIDKNGEVRLVDTECVITVDVLPETGVAGKVYICEEKFYYWNGLEFIAPQGSENVSEEIVDSKVEEAVKSANDYTDEQITAVMDEVAAAYRVVEF